MLQPKYTMQNFEWQDQRGIEGTGFVRALRSLLTANLPTLLPRLKEIIKQELQLETQLRMRADGSQNHNSSTYSLNDFRLTQVRYIERSHLPSRQKYHCKGQLFRFFWRAAL